MFEFYAPEIKENPFLPEEESFHCNKVLRMKDGDEIIVVDGKGNCYSCEIIGTYKKQTEVKILTTEKELNRKYKITLAVAPTKSFDRIEWMVQKCVEIGIDEFLFVKCQHSERKEVRADRIEKLLVSAMKQSLRATLPKFAYIDNFKKFIDLDYSGYQKFMGYCSPDCPRKEFVKNIAPSLDTLILVGPEGDFSPEEVNLALASGFSAVSFGDMRLRTETAGLYGVATIHIINSLFANS